MFKVAVRLAICITSSMGWHCNTIDVKAVYLQGNIIEREVYMWPADEYYNGKLWKANKIAYGLCAVARAWYLKVKSEILLSNTKSSSLEPALFSWRSNDAFKGIICVYVDDFLWGGTTNFQDTVTNKLSDLFLVGGSESRSWVSM